MNVLIVDDYADIADVFSQIAEAHGHKSVIATSAEEAINVVAEQCPDLVFLDISLGIADGIEVCRTMRRHCPPSKCRIVAMSGYAEAKLQCEPDLFDGFLLKPIPMDEFEGWLKAVSVHPR